MKRMVLWLLVLSAVFLAACSTQGAASTGSASQSTAADSSTVEISADNGEQLIIDNDGIQIFYTGLSQHETLGPQIDLRIENNGSDSLSFDVADVSVNDMMTTAHIGASVPVGKTANDSVLIYQQGLDDLGISDADIQSVEFSLLGMAYDADTDIYQVVWRAGPVVINFS